MTWAFQRGIGSAYRSIISCPNRVGPICHQVRDGQTLRRNYGASEHRGGGGCIGDDWSISQLARHICRPYAC